MSIPTHPHPVPAGAGADFRDDRGLSIGASEGGRLLTRPAVARRCGVGVGTVQAWIDSGELAAVNLAADARRKPRWFVSPAALEDFLRRHAKVPATTAPVPRRQQRDRRDPNSELFRH